MQLAGSMKLYKVSRGTNQEGISFKRAKQGKRKRRKQETGARSLTKTEIQPHLTTRQDFPYQSTSTFCI
jgi:hypothetical protein